MTAYCYHSYNLNDKFAPYEITQFNFLKLYSIGYKMAAEYTTLQYCGLSNAD